MTAAAPTLAPGAEPDPGAVRRRAAADPTLAPLVEGTDRLSAAFPGAALLGEPLAAGRRLVLLPALTLGRGWTPSPVAGLLDCSRWPHERPILRLHESLRRDGAPPVTVAVDYEAGHGWLQFSFNCPYDPAASALIPVVRGWLRRFDGRP